MKSSVTISIPIYNDMYAIQDLMSELLDIKLENIELYFLLIDDGSTDQSSQVIRDLYENHARVNTIYHSENKGFGYTIKECITTPQTDYIIFISGDYQFRKDAVTLLIQSIQDADYVLGNRIKRADNWKRRLTSRVYNVMISYKAQWKVKDVNSVFAIKRIVLSNIELNSQSAFIHAELFFKLAQKKARIKMVDIPHHARVYGQGSGGKLSIILPTFWEMLRFFIH